IDLCRAESIDEAYLLSTCNRTEIYLLAHREPDAYRLALDTVFARRAPEIAQEGRFYVKRGEVAVRHLLEVACGLQSMVLGEPEILAQVKQATSIAATAEAIGPVLERLLVTAAGAGGRARQETAIGGGAVSFGYAVVELARTVFQRLDRSTVLILGAGELAIQVARSLHDREVKALIVANRSAERAEQFRQTFPDATIVPFTERARTLPDADIVVASTGATEPILSRADFENAMIARRRQPLLAIDLGVPRNIDSNAAQIENLFLQDIDTLETLIERNLKRRREEVPRVHEILDRERERFEAWYRGLDAEPLIAQLQQRAETIRRAELAQASKRIPVEYHDDLDRLTRAVVRKILHHPSLHLRQAETDRTRRLDLVRELFRLDDEAAP
ncbi:MAG: glutamyl-tRNA reductase, partial [Acidobacteriota bacterium]